MKQPFFRITAENGGNADHNSLEPPSTNRRKPSIAAKVSKRLSEVKRSLKTKQGKNSISCLKKFTNFSGVFKSPAAFMLDLDVVLDDDEPKRRYSPERLETLCNETGLSKPQLRALYRSFKEACPNGAISEPIFREIYCQMFPLGGRNGHFFFTFLI